MIRRFSRASLAGDSAAMCALVDRSKLRYLEQIGQPCEISLGGTLTPESDRDVRRSTVTSLAERNAIDQKIAALEEQESRGPALPGHSVLWHSHRRDDGTCPPSRRSPVEPLR